MHIRPATIADLSHVESLAQEFYASSEHLQNFRLEVFQANWTNFLTCGMGAMFFLTDGHKLLGAIGGLKYPDPNNGELIALEAFWWVTKAARGHGLKLYFEFERWAREQGCQRLQMCHLVDSMPEKLQRFYERRGLRKF